MNLKKLLEQLNGIYFDLEDVADAHTVTELPRAIKKIHSSLGEIIQNIEDDLVYQDKPDNE